MTPRSIYKDGEVYHGMACSAREDSDEEELIPSKSPEQLKRRQSSFWSRYGLRCLLLGLTLGSLLFSDRAMTIIASLPAAADSKTPVDGPTFMFHVGIEGTGHHFIQALVRKAPFVADLNRVGANVHLGFVREAFMEGIMMPYCDDLEMNDPQELFRKMSQSLMAADALLKDQTNVSHIPVNTLDHVHELQNDKHELSYPDAKKCNRIMHPNIDVFYRACEEAQVKCGAVYLYRDPYAVVQSSHNRKFHTNVQQGIHLYTMMLQLIYAQLSFAPEKMFACVGLYDDNAPDEERWHPIRDMYGWTDAKAFDEFVDSVYVPPTPLNATQKEALVPPAYREHMRAMVHAHDKVIKLCRQMVQDNNRKKR